MLQNAKREIHAEWPGSSKGATLLYPSASLRPATQSSTATLVPSSILSVQQLSKIFTVLLGDTKEKSIIAVMH